MALELLAPAKLNLVLEITGRRDDGYHDIVSVMQTIDLADRVRVSGAPAFEIVVSGAEQRAVPAGPQNLAYAAAQALAQSAGTPGLGARIEVMKNIPAGMGLGGGSSDAAAVLRGLNQLWGLKLPAGELMSIGSTIGSDVPFFVAGGSALIGGRGEGVDALPDASLSEATLFLPDVQLQDKTRRMYAGIGPSDFSDGHRARSVAERVRRGHPLAENDLFNVFDSHVAALSESLAAAISRCHAAGLSVVTAGSGPAFFSPTPIAAVPPRLIEELARQCAVRAVGCRPLPRDAAMTIRQV